LQERLVTGQGPGSGTAGHQRDVRGRRVFASEVRHDFGAVRAGHDPRRLGDEPHMEPLRRQTEHLDRPEHVKLLETVEQRHRDRAEPAVFSV
jgi:hypothetical protein